MLGVIASLFMIYDIVSSRKLALWSLRELSFTIHIGSRELGQIACGTLSGPFTVVNRATTEMIDLEPIRSRPRPQNF